MSEISPQTSTLDLKQKIPPATIRRMFGITTFAPGGNAASVRGMWEMGGLVYVVIGPTLFQLSAAGALTLLATGIQTSGPAGSFVRMTDNTQCLVILIPGTKVAYTYTPNASGTKFLPLTAETFLFYGAIDAWFVDSYIVFLSLNGLVLFNDDGAATSGANQITFNTGGVYPREFGTDPFVGMCVDHRTVLMFGRRTSEGYIDSGNPQESPFANAPDTFMQIGCHPSCGYSVQLQDQSVFWVANDLTVRRRNGQTPVRVSNSGIEALLEKNKMLLTGCYAMCPTIGGHPLWILTIPLASSTIVYDCLTTEWFELESLINNLGYWRPLCYYNAFGMQLVGDSQSANIGYLDARTYTEFGSPMRASFSTQSVYDSHNRITHRRVECVITAGEAASSGTGNSEITLYASDDSGKTTTARAPRFLGAKGDRLTRAVWFNLGQARDRSYTFQVSDPTPLFTVDILAELDGGRW